MARHFFETAHGGLHEGETGTESLDLSVARAIAGRTLMGIAAEEATRHDRHTGTVVVREADGTSILGVTLVVTTAWSNGTEA